MGTISLSIPQTGQPNSTQDPLVASDFTTLLAWANGGIDGDNLSAAGAQSAGMNQSGQTVKGAVNIPTSESRTNTAYGTLATPDQVTGIVLPTNGLIRVGYQATWQESVQNTARAAIFIGSNQLKIAGNPSPGAQEINLFDGTNPPAGTPISLFTFTSGISRLAGASAYTGDVTTGQILGGAAVGGGTLDIQGLPAGTYTVSVQFKASSGSVTASNRKLWVQAISF